MDALEQAHRLGAVVSSCQRSKGAAMQIGMIAHPSTSASIARQWLNAGHQVVGFDPYRGLGRETWPREITWVDRLDDLAIALSPPRALWIALPDRAGTEQAYNALLSLLGKGDTVIDAGASYYKDTLRRAQVFSRFQCRLIDVGVCGEWPFAGGRCMAIGGDLSTIERLGWIFEALRASLDQDWGRVGPEGAGHFARMVHRAMASAMARVAAEGLAILGRKADPALDVPRLAALWSGGDATHAHLSTLAPMDQAATASQASPRGEALDASWILDEASELLVAIPVLACSLLDTPRMPPS